MIKNMCYYYYC